MTDRIAIFIDGPSVFRLTKVLGFDMDYAGLTKGLVGGGKLFRPYYYAVTADDGEFEAIMPLLDWLEFHGFTVRARAGQSYIDPQTNTRKVRGQVAVELAVEAVTMAGFYERAVIVSSDGELAVLVDALQRLGKTVVVASVMRLCADELRRQADTFIDLEAMRPQIARPARPQKEAVSA